MTIKPLNTGSPPPPEDDPVIPGEDPGLSPTDPLLVDFGERKIRTTHMAEHLADLVSLARAYQILSDGAEVNFEDAVTQMEAYVDAQLAAFNAGVLSVNGDTGVVTLTKASVGLENVDNTSDAGKPVSTAQQTALNLKANDADVVKSNDGDQSIAGGLTLTGALNATSLSGSGPNITDVPLAAGTTGTLALARGGTGATTAQGAREAIGAHDAANLTTGVVPLARLENLGTSQLAAAVITLLNNGAAAHAALFDDDPRGLVKADGETANVVWVEEASDLSPYLNAGEYLLPAGATVLVNGTVDLGADYIRLSEGTVLRGLSNAVITSTNTGGVIRCAALDAAVVIRELTVVAPAGSCLDLQGPGDQQCNLFFLGLIGASAGTLDGFSVQAVKDCFINAGSGIVHKGICRKVFVSSSVFYGVTAGNSAILLDETLDTHALDVTTCLFKFDDGTCLTKHASSSVETAFVRTSLIDGTAAPLSGVTSAELGWTFRDNTGIPDSRATAMLTLDTEAETVITTVDTPVKVAGTTAPSSVNERFSHANNRLTYLDARPRRVSATATFSVAAGNNNELGFYLAKNGSVVADTKAMVKTSSGTDVRGGACAGILDLAEDDYIELWVENNDGTGNLTCVALVLTITD